MFCLSNQCERNHFNVTCPGEGGDGAEAEGSVEAPRQGGGGSLALARTLLAVDELGEVGGRGGDEGLCQVWRLAAEGEGCRAACKVSATQEQRHGLLPEIKIITRRNKILI